MDDITYGKKCEIIATNYLKNKGYKKIKNNYKNKIGEIDIIAKDNNTIVFVEVKGRFTRALGDPFEAINYTKQQKIRNVATFYLKVNGLLNAPCRFDAIAVLGDSDAEIRHIVDAFS